MKKEVSIQEISICDMHGKLIADKIRYEDSKIDIREINSGMYVITVEFKNGTRQSKNVRVNN